MADGASEGDPFEEHDPFAGVVFDDDFVRSAAIVEESAEQRERAARQANLQRLLSDEEARRENEAHARRRYAPDDDDPFADVADGDRRPPRRGRLVVALVVIVAILAAYVLSHFLRTDRGTATDVPPPTTVATVPAQDAPTDDVTDGSSVEAATPVFERPANWPSASAEQQAAPLGVAPTVTETGSHAFVQMQPDGTRPVAYDPCRPIHYVTRAAGAPEGIEGLLSEAIATLSAATGLVFVDDGATDEPPTDGRTSFQPERYGDRWAPVLISWSDPGESPRLAETQPGGADGTGVADVLGYAGSNSAGLTSSDSTTPDRQIFVTGALTFDGPDFTELLGRFDGYARARSVVLHELAHLVGLDHVDDATQLMSPVLNDGVTEYAAGDRQGLAELGRGVCLPEV